ncbi:MAG: HTTM domain-containing protein [Cyanobacteria bacterium P01_G01_bin.38]
MFYRALSPLNTQLSRILFSPVNIAFLVFFRMAFGAIMLWEIWRYFYYDWIYDYWIAPGFNFTYHGLGWVQPWPGEFMYWHFAALGVLAVFILVGFCYRVSAILFCLGFTYVFLLEQAHYLNHFYLISLISLLMVFLPAHRLLSVDVLLKPKLLTHTAPVWTLWLLRFQIGVPYFFGGVAKLNGDWLRGQPMGLWLSEATDFPVMGAFFTEPWMALLLSYGGLLLDLLIVPLLLWKPTRGFAFSLAVLFHLTNARLFSIGIFPWFMIAATTVFFAPNWPQQLFGWLKGTIRRAPKRGRQSHSPVQPFSVSTLSAPNPRQRLALMGLALYVGFQCVMPLRHYLYPGNANWTEEGHRFAWHMKLRDKAGTAKFFVRNPTSGKVQQVWPEDYLTARQARKMAARPDMVVQFSHFLAAESTPPGEPSVEVRAWVMASLNGRAPQMLIDPNQDLAKISLSFQPADWILPLREAKAIAETTEK